MIALRELVEQWRDDSWDFQRSGRPELRDLAHGHANQLAELLDQLEEQDAANGQ